MAPYDTPVDPCESHPRGVEHSRLLRRALLANAAFSGTSGGVMLLAPGLVGDWLGLSAEVILRMLGAGLILFGLDVALQARAAFPHPGRALLTTANDLGWVVGSAILLIGWSHLFSTTGTLLVLAVASLVAAFAVAQYAGLRRLLAEPAAAIGTTHRHTTSVIAEAPPAAMWDVIADLAAIERYSPGLASTTLAGDGAPGLAAQRICVAHNGTTWTESVTSWTPRSYAVAFDPSAPDFPYPVSAMLGGWRVSPHPDGSRVDVWFSFTPRTRLPHTVLAVLAGLGLDRDFRRTIARMALDARADAAGEPRPDPATAPPRGTARLIPAIC